MIPVLPHYIQQLWTETDMCVPLRTIHCHCLSTRTCYHALVLCDSRFSTWHRYLFLNYCWYIFVSDFIFHNWTTFKDWQASSLTSLQLNAWRVLKSSNLLRFGGVSFDELAKYVKDSACNPSHHEDEAYLLMVRDHDLVCQGLRVKSILIKD